MNISWPSKAITGPKDSQVDLIGGAVQRQQHRRQHQRDA